MVKAENEPKIESITIVSGGCISDVERANLKITEDDYAEVMVIKNSPKRLETKGIKRGEKPTEGFRKAIKEAGLIDVTF